MTQFQEQTEADYEYFDDTYPEEQYTQKRKRLAAPYYEPAPAHNWRSEVVAWFFVGSMGLMLAGGSLAYVLSVENASPAVFLFPMLYMLGAMRIMRRR